MGNKKIGFCDDCFYCRRIYQSGPRYCAYLMITNERRPCPPGDECTVKVPIEVKRRKKAEERKNSIKLTYKGETKTLNEWAAIFDINRSTLHDRIKKRGWSVERALETPVSVTKRYEYG